MDSTAYHTSGPFDIHDVLRNAVKAFDEARRKLLDMVWLGTITTPAEGRSAFVAAFRNELKEIFDVNLSNVTVNQNTCGNESGTANYGVDVKIGKASPGECVYQEN